MAGVIAETPSEGRVRPALRKRISIHNLPGCFSQTRLDPNVSAEMPFTRTPSPPRSRSRSRASTTDASQPRQISTPLTLSIDLHSPASREPSETRYRLYSSHPARPYHEEPLYCKFPRVERSHKSTSVLRANDNSCSRRESTTPPSELSGQLTPFSNTSSSKSKDVEVKRPLVPGSLCSSTHSGEQERQNPASGGFDAIEEVDSTLKPELMDSPRPSNDSGDLASDEDVEMGDVYDESESDDDSTEERWIPTLKEFEASIVAATGGNLPLAARLIPQLQEIFRQEKSPVIGIWETTYRKSAGNSHDCDSGASAGGGDSRHPYKGQDNDRKRQRRDDEDTGEENNSQEGNGDDKRQRPESSAAEGFGCLEFACPFKKKNPEKYNGDYRSSNVKKGEYKKCDSGFDNDKMFREHLMRTHLFAQCGKCSEVFTDRPREERELAFKTHQEAIEQCRGTAPDVNEGITEVQWARIKKLPRKSRSTPPEKLNVKKWNEIWKILFPDERIPTPWHTPTRAKLEKHSNLALDIAEFKKCYNSAINDTENENLSSEETAAHAFTKWWAKRFAEQRKRQKMSQEAPQRNAETEAGYTPKEEGRSDQAMDFPNTRPGQGRVGMRGFQSLQLPLQGSSTGQASQGNPLAQRRAVTGTNPGYQVAHHGYGQTPASPQPHPAQLGPNPVYYLSEEIMHQPQHGIDPMKLINTGGGQPHDATFDHEEYFIQLQQLDGWAASTDIPAEYIRLFNDPNPLPISETSPAPQANPVPLRPRPQPLPLPQSQPQYPTPTYNISKPQQYYAQQQQGCAAAGHSVTTNNNPYGNAPVQNPLWELSVDRQRRRRGSEQRRQQHSSDYDDPNRRHDGYGG